MRNRRNIVIAILLVAVAVISCFASSYITKQNDSDAREECCKNQIKFAIAKVENQDLADSGVMRALISNVYAAYQYCDDSISAQQLHNLWNYLIFESDEDLDSAKEIALQELEAVLNSIQTK